MPSVPGCVDRAKLMAALNDLGIDTANLSTLTADARRIRLTYLAVDAEGKNYLTEGAPTEITYEVMILNTGGLVSVGCSNALGSATQGEP